MRSRFFSGLGLALAFLASPSFAAPKVPVDPAVLQKARGGVIAAFDARPAADGSATMLPARARVPVVVEFVGAPTNDDVAALLLAGAELERRHDGGPYGVRNSVAATLSLSSLRRVAALPRVARIELDGPLFAPPPPLDYTAREVQATDVWNMRDDAGLSLTGHGVTVCDVDSGLDVFHPLLFRADAGYFGWIDEDGDGLFSPDVDSVDVDGSVTKLAVLNVPITYFWDPAPIQGSDDPSLQIGLDFLYADKNADGVRNYGRDAGFDDSTPALGEPLFAVDDVNKNGTLDVGEKLVRFGSSKVAVFRVDSKRYRRGENLSDAPRDAEFSHGAGATSVIAGGARGLTKLVGMAPDADIVMAHDTQGDRQVTMTNFCVDEGARVVLHEYAPWVGYHLDGSSQMEQLIDDTSATGVSHINPAGNLSGASKLYVSTFTGGTHDINIEAPDDYPGGAFHFIGATLLYRDATRDLLVTLEDPTGATLALPLPGEPFAYVDWGIGLKLYAETIRSSRDTVQSTFYVYSASSNGPSIPTGTWTMHVSEPSPVAGDLTLIAYVQDDLSGWGQGIYFPDNVSEDHLVGWPGTADHGMGIAAYTGHGTLGGTPGDRAYYSGRGHRIDGALDLWISAPDDPTTAGLWPEYSVNYQTYGGTSGASPHVAGVAALLIQQDPSRTGDQVREAIKNGAVADSFTGAVPNDDYGYGKLRAYRSLFGQDPEPNAAPTLTIERATVDIGKDTPVALTVADADDELDSLTFEVDRDYDGAYEEKLTTAALPVRFDAIGTYTMKLRVTDPGGKTAEALAVVDAIQPPPEPEPPGDPFAGLSPGGGGLCSASPGSHVRDISLWASVGLVGAAAGVRRRARRKR